jgi:hypothetical protein
VCVCVTLWLVSGKKPMKTFLTIWKYAIFFLLGIAFALYLGKFQIAVHSVIIDHYNWFNDWALIALNWTIGIVEIAYLLAIGLITLHISIDVLKWKDYQTFLAIIVNLILGCLFFSIVAIVIMSVF